MFDVTCLRWYDCYIPVSVLYAIFFKPGFRSGYVKNRRYLSLVSPAAHQFPTDAIAQHGAVEFHTQVCLQPGEVATPQLEGAGQGIGHLAAEHHLLLLHAVGSSPHHELGGGALRLVGGVGALAAQPLAFQGYAAAAFGGGERGVTVAQANGKRAAQHGGHIGQVQPAAEDKGVARSVAQVAHVAEVEGAAARRRRSRRHRCEGHGGR